MELKRLEHIYDVSKHLRAYQRALSGANENASNDSMIVWLK